ncbi:MAG: hypothetical protein Q4A09_05010 [Capnocytophaga felis]|nr:hypothetical protein [Capnocytophaga felis]
MNNEQITKFEKDNTYQRILASHLDDSFELTTAEETIKKRLRHIFSLRLNNKLSRHQAIQMQMREMSVSQATAYRDYKWAMQIYGELDKTDRNAERMILAENYYQLYQMALKERNIEQARRALDSYAALFNFDKEEEIIDLEKIQAHEYHIKMSRKSHKILQVALSGGVIDFNNLTAEDVDYKEVDEDEIEE